MTVSSTTEPGVKSKPRAKPAPKSDEQRAKEKEDNLTRKTKLKAAIDVAIDQIDNIIEALADEYNIGFSQACNYVHLGGRVFKDRRRPTIQNAYSFCWARVEDGRCECAYPFATVFSPSFPVLRERV
jgi:Pup-like protein